MSRDVLLDQAAQLISDARVACLKLAISPEDIAKIMMDEAVLALMAERVSQSSAGVFRNKPPWLGRAARLAATKSPG